MPFKEERKTMDIKTLEHLCELSKLDLNGEEKERMLFDMSSIVGLMDTIKDFNLDYDDTADLNEINLSDLREDICRESFPVETLMKNTISRDNCYVIPKMIE